MPRGGEWSYKVTDFRSGASVSEHWPLTDVSFSDSLNDGGSLTAKCPVGLASMSTDIRDDFWRRVIWPCRDGVPMFAGVLTAAPAVALDSPTMSLVCKRVDAVFDKRPIENDLVYTQVDQFNIAR